MHIPCEDRLQARLVAYPRLEASDRDFRRSFSVLATESIWEFAPKDILGYDRICKDM